MFEQKEIDFLEELELLIDYEEYEFEKVYYADADIEITQAQLEELFQETPAMLVVEGTLTVLGALKINKQHGIHVSHQVTCEQLWISTGLVSVDQVHAKKFAEFAVSADEMLDTLDMSGLKTPLVLITSEPPSCQIESQFSLDLIDFDDPGSFSALTASNYQLVIDALKDDVTIDDDWVSQHSE